MSTLAQIRKRVGILNGEGDPSDVSRLATIDELIRTIIEDIRSRQQWSFDQDTLDVVFNSSGVSNTTLTDFTLGSLLDARKVNTGDGDDEVYSLIDSWNADKYSTQYYPIWITGNDVDGWKLNIKDLDSRTLKISYVLSETALTDAADETRIPLNVIALGTYALLLKSDDNETVIDREKNDYESEIIKLKKIDDRYPKRAISISEQQGYSLGDI